VDLITVIVEGGCTELEEDEGVSRVGARALEYRFLCLYRGLIVEIEAGGFGVAVREVFAEFVTDGGTLIDVMDMGREARLLFRSSGESNRGVLGVAVCSLDEDTLELDGEVGRENSEDDGDNEGVDGVLGRCRAAIVSECRVSREYMRR